MAQETENHGGEDTQANLPARPADDNNPPSPPPRLTNFFIDEILKPEFGRRRDNKDLPLDITTTIKPLNSPGSPDGNSSSGSSSSPEDKPERSGKPPMLWPAWVYCTRYSDRPSSGPRSRKIKKKEKKPDEKRPRTAFTNEQLARLKKEFDENRYLTESRRQDLARELKLNESQIKIWFQNKRAKAKKSSGVRNSLAMHLMAQGLYNHSTVMDGIEQMDHAERMELEASLAASAAAASS